MHWDAGAVPVQRGCVSGAGCRCEGLHSLFAGLSASCYPLCENTSSICELVVKRGGKTLFFLYESALSMEISPGSFDACSVRRERLGSRRLPADAAVPRQQPRTFLFHPSKSSSSREDAEPPSKLPQRACCSSLSVPGPHPCVPAAVWVAPLVGRSLCISLCF